MASTEPWQIAEIPGPKKAIAITRPETLVALVKRSGRPIIIVGHKASGVFLKEAGTLIDWAIRISKASGIPIVATGHAMRAFIERGFQPKAYMPAVDVVNRLKDPDWKGLDGKGPYDLAIFMGLQYYFAWNLLSGLKHFSQKLRTLSLDRFYQPHASFSLPNLSVEEWENYLKVLENALKGG